MCHIDRFFMVVCDIQALQVAWGGFHGHLCHRDDQHNTQPTELHFFLN